MTLSEAELTELQKKKKTRFPLTRIKKIIQQNEDIGKTAVMVPVVLSRATELFVGQMVGKMVENAENRKSRKVSKQDFKEVVEGEAGVYGFLGKLLNTAE